MQRDPVLLHKWCKCVRSCATVRDNRTAFVFVITPFFFWSRKATMPPSNENSTALNVRLLALHLVEPDVSSGVYAFHHVSRDVVRRPTKKNTIPRESINIRRENIRRCCSFTCLSLGFPCLNNSNFFGDAIVCVAERPTAAAQ